jgi:hypothetical protein
MLHETNLGYEVQFIGRLDKASPSLIAEYHGDEAVLYIDTVLLFKLEILAQLEMTVQEECHILSFPRDKCPGRISYSLGS